jgi:hypothetical protein
MIVVARSGEGPLWTLDLAEAPLVLFNLQEPDSSCHGMDYHRSMPIESGVKPVVSRQ